MTDIALCLTELVKGLDHRQEGELLALAQQRGLLLRRVRMQERNWARQDLGILIAWETATQQFVVIDASGGRAPSRVSLDGKRHLMSLADCAALHIDMLALASPKGRSLHESHAAVALLGMLSAQTLVLLALAEEPQGVRAALVLLLAGLAWVLARAAYSVTSSRASILIGWRLHHELWRDVLERGLTMLRSRTPRDYAQEIRSSLERRIGSLRGSTELPMGLATLLPGLGVLAVTAPELGFFYALVWVPLLSAAIAARRFLAVVENHETQGLGDAEQRLDLVAQFNIRLRPLGAEGFALTRLEAATRRQRGLARRQRGLLQTALASEALLLALTVAVSIVSTEAMSLTTSVTVAGLTVALGLVEVGRAAAAMTVRTRSLNEKPPQIAPTYCQSDADEVLESIELSGVTFQYPGALSPLFKPTDLLVRRGEIVAVTGPSGVGKSTLLRLALDILPPMEGELRINGKPVSKGDQKAWRRQVGVVLQDEHVPVETLKSFLLGMSGLPLETALPSLETLGLLKEIEALPMGIQTIIAEGMMPLGLMERLLIARALFRRPTLLVLDEATAGLDEDVQTRLMTELRTAGIGVLIATHRASAVEIADRRVEVAPY